MSEEEKKLQLDLTSQAHLANNNIKIKSRILHLLKKVADKDCVANMHRGALIVLGEFVRYNYQVPGMRQIGSNPLAGSVLFVTDKDVEEDFKKLLGEDGAIVVDITGQVLASRVYLQVNHADAHIDDECSARHIAAVSYSLTPHVVACFTLSEETGKVRKYIDGEQISVYDPSIKTAEADDEV